jgi:hypothetical protein
MHGINNLKNANFVIIDLLLLLKTQYYEYISITIHEHQLPTAGIVTLSIRLVSKGGAMFLFRLNFHNSRFVVAKLMTAVVRLLYVLVKAGVEIDLEVNVTGII